MTRTVPRVIFVEKRKKKGPVWGPYAYGGKTRATLLETRSTKSMRVNARMQNFVFFNSSNESENSDNEFSTLANRTVFYYGRQPPKLNAERKTALLTMNEVHKFIREKPTARKFHQENN